jgi:hypothetical protein
MTENELTERILLSLKGHVDAWRLSNQENIAVALEDG